MMLKNNSRHYGELRQFLDNLPAIDTHEHYAGYLEADEDTLDFILANYMFQDFLNGGGEHDFMLKPGTFQWIMKKEGLTPAERYEIFLRTYKNVKNTAYSRGVMEGLRQCWGVDSVENYEGILELEKKLKTRSPSTDARIMEKFKIKARISNIGIVKEFDAFLWGEVEHLPTSYFSVQVNDLHDFHCAPDLARLQKYLNRPVACLDDYLECIDLYFEKFVGFGAVCIKDTSAYDRSLAFNLPSKYDAEKAFNDIIFNPRDMFGDDRTRPMEDWLFHHIIRKAAAYDLPVQLHTGHMAVTRNEITKTNAAHLIPTMELHKNVRFDLFHGNWPYMDEYLFIGKNYPNAYLNLCWAQHIDPIYCIELMKRAVMTVPQNKIFAFGGDVAYAEYAAGYLSIARDNVACALSELVESEWLDMDEARQIAKDWFFNNPNNFYKLGFEAV